MKLEVGKYYKSREGLKFKCVHELKSNDDYRFLTVIDDGLLHQLNDIDGFSLHAPRYDLISEWVEPVVHEFEMALLKMNAADGRTFISLQNISSIAPWDNSSIIARKTIKITEGEGL